MEHFEMTQEAYLIAREKLRSVFFFVLIGMVIGGSIGYLVTLSMPGNAYNFMTIIVFALLLSGIPYTWRAFGYTALTWKGFLIKFIITLLLGWIVTPFLLLMNFIQMKTYERRTVRQLMKEGECGNEKYLFTMICAATCVVAGVLYVAAEFMSVKFEWNLSGQSKGFLELIIIEIFVLVSSILWILFRSSTIVPMIDMLMDMVIMWFLRNAWFFVFIIFSEKMNAFMYLVFVWDVFVFLDAVVFVVMGLIKRGKTVRIEKTEE